jgi:hypothetical protein
MVRADLEAPAHIHTILRLKDRARTHTLHHQFIMGFAMDKVERRYGERIADIKRCIALLSKRKREEEAALEATRAALNNVEIELAVLEKERALAVHMVAACQEEKPPGDDVSDFTVETLVEALSPRALATEMLRCHRRLFSAAESSSMEQLPVAAFDLNASSST